MNFAEFVVRTGDETEYHQAKRAFAESGRWSIKTLLRENLLVPFKEKLQTGGHNRCVFVSGQDADHLRALSKAARSALSPQEFADQFLSSDPSSSRSETFMRAGRSRTRERSSSLSGYHRPPQQPSSLSSYSANVASPQVRRPTERGRSR